MKFKISKTDVSIKNTFVLVIEFMHGDADGYSTEEYHYSTPLQAVGCIEFYERCIEKYPHGMGGNDGYWDVKGYKEFGDEVIPMGSAYAEGHANVQNIKMFYYNGVGAKFEVEYET